jgi:hypothetical protein
MDNINKNDNNHIKNSGRALSGFIIAIIGFAFLLHNLGLKYSEVDIELV